MRYLIFQLFDGFFCRSKLRPAWKGKPKNQPNKPVTLRKTKTGQRVGQERDREENNLFFKLLFYRKQEK